MILRKFYKYVYIIYKILSTILCNSNFLYTALKYIKYDYLQTLLATIAHFSCNVKPMNGLKFTDFGLVPISIFKQVTNLDDSCNNFSLMMYCNCFNLAKFLEKEYKETCSGHGRYLLARCKCDRLYYGSRCQYREECIENNDCGDHGICIDIDATTAPSKQCYCKTGYYGFGCRKSKLL